ncbi:MAG: amidohydrolase [Clostridia bacterium]|nr:amidohydrolase [Clostridia bacterium]
MKNIWYQAALAMKDETVRLYRRLHQIPEVAYQETETHAFLRETLDRWGVPYAAPDAHITVAQVQGALPGAVVGIRCDTDALPVQEETGAEFASLHPGVMHACGHDAHMAGGLSAIRMLLDRKNDLHGLVKVIFQPAEEGEAGADQVIATGLADDVDVFFAIHVWSPYETGTLHIAPVTVSAAVDMFTITLSGSGGHGATPEKCCDAITAGAALVQSLQTVVSRRVSPMQPAVLTIGSFHAGAVGNIIAERAELSGTIRALDEETRTLIETETESIMRQVAAAYHCGAELKNRRISDVVRNDGRAAELARRCALEMADEKLVQPQRAMMIGDDFANYGRIAPICYAQVGIADREKDTDYPHHSGHFRVDEDVLPLCAAWMASFAFRAGMEWNGGENR